MGDLRDQCYCMHILMFYGHFSEVRRAGLLHIPITPVTLPTIISRTQDVDPTVRKLVYCSILLPHFKHPELLTISQRERIVRNGLRDSDIDVRAATESLLGTWFDTVAPEHDGDGAPVLALVRFLQIFDVYSTAAEGVSADALSALFSIRKKVFNNVAFNGKYIYEYFTIYLLYALE